VSAKEVMMTSNRNLIIGAVVVAVAIAFFAIRAYNAMPPQTTPAATTEPKK
jgi:hypothetical protein